MLNLRNQFALCLIYPFVAFLSLCLGAGSANAYFLIDNYSSTGNVIASGYNNTSSNYWNIGPNGWYFSPAQAGQPVTVSESGLAGVLGGTRFTTAQFTTASLGNSIGLDINAGGFEFLSTGAGSVYGWIKTLYNAGGAGLNANFSAETAIRTIFDPDHLAFGKDSIMKITLSDADSSFTVEKRWRSPQDYVSQPGVQTVDFLFSSFSGIDFNSIKSVEVFYEGDFSNDLAFHSVSTVPIPAAAWLLCTGIVGLVALKRKVLKQ
jgi:hypothetical protein